MAHPTTLAVSDLVSAIEESSGTTTEGLDVLLRAVLEVSITSEEGRFPRVRVRAEYRDVHLGLIQYSGALGDLPKLVQAVPYPGFELVCSWLGGEWKVCGVDKERPGGTGIVVDMHGPMSIKVTLPDQYLPGIEVVRGEIRKSDHGWESVLSRLSGSTLPTPIPQNEPLRAVAIGRAIYEVSLAGHGGVFLVLPPDPASCIDDLSIGMPAALGHEFELLSGNYGHPDNEARNRCAKALAGLAGVDGAMVFSSDLSLIGFNATILTEFVNAPDLVHRGHRHKSAASFCRKHAGAVAFVVSQDGPITVFGG